MSTYREGYTPGRELEAVLKEYKPHQHVSTVDKLKLTLIYLKTV